MMKCLSLKQPFAELLVRGEKTIELRNWNTMIRGKFLIHASKNIDIETCKRLNIDIYSFTIGAIIGYASLYDVKEYKNQEEFNKDKQKHFSIISKYFDGYKYGFLVKDTRIFKKSIPYSGKLEFFEVIDSLIII